MRKNMMKFGTMALAASMMLTPATSVFAADESQETVIAAEENVSDIDTDNTITSTDNDINMNVDETFDEDDYGVEPTGIITFLSNLLTSFIPRNSRHHYIKDYQMSICT